MFKLFIAEKLCKCSRKTWLDRSVSPLRILIFLGNQTNMHWIIFLSKDFCIAKITLVLIHFTMVREYLFFLIWCQRLRRWFIWLSCTFGWHQFQNMGYLFMDSIVECTEHTQKKLFWFYSFILSDFKHSDFWECSDICMAVMKTSSSLLWILPDDTEELAQHKRNLLGRELRNQPLYVPAETLPCMEEAAQANRQLHLPLFP